MEPLNKVLEILIKLTDAIGIYLPVVFILLVAYLFSKVSTNNASFLFKKPEDINYSRWAMSFFSDDKAKKAGLYSLSGLALIYISKQLSPEYLGPVIAYLGFAGVGVGFGFLLHKLTKPFFHSNPKGFFKPNGKLGIVDAMIIGNFLLYQFINYFQLIWETKKNNPEEGRIRYIFYFSGIALWHFMNMLIILIGTKNRLSVFSVIILFTSMNLFLVEFANYLFELDNIYEYEIVLGLTVASVVVLFQENVRIYKQSAK